MGLRDGIPDPGSIAGGRVQAKVRLTPQPELTIPERGTLFERQKPTQSNLLREKEAPTAETEEGPGAPCG